MQGGRLSGKQECFFPHGSSHGEVTRGRDRKQRQTSNLLMGLGPLLFGEAYYRLWSYYLLILINRGFPVQFGTPPPNCTSSVCPVFVTASLSRRRKHPSFSIHSTHQQRPAAAERHSSNTHTVRRLNGSSHRHRQFGAGPVPHNQNRRLRVTCPSYTLESAWDTILVFGRTRRLQTADMNSCPPLRLTRVRHNRTGSGSALARYRFHCISRN